MDAFKYNQVSYERIGKTYKVQYPTIRKIAYTPDFVGSNWVMETKGMQTPEFKMK